MAADRLLERFPITSRGDSIKIGDWLFKLVPADGSPILPVDVQRAAIQSMGCTSALVRELKAARYAIRVLLQALEADPDKTHVSFSAGATKLDQSMSMDDLLRRFDEVILAADL